MTKIYNYLKKDFTQLQSLYESNGTVTWATFMADQNLHQKKVVLVSEVDFAEGTLRVMYPCLIRFTENVQFNPNRPQTWLDAVGNITSDATQAVALDPNRMFDWFPTADVPSNVPLYLTGGTAQAYQFGFFAAITVEAAGVIVDLNDFTLSQHPEHALVQRFFALIELAAQPFSSNEEDVKTFAAKRTWIKNGTLGLSSHYGIHGNNSREILITNIAFKDFEIAAVHLSGSERVAFADSHVLGNRQDIPVCGLYSCAILNVRFSKFLKGMNVWNSEVEKAYSAVRYNLDKIFNDIIFGFTKGTRLVKGFINLNCKYKNRAGQSGDSSLVIFDNSQRLVDESAYGVVFVGSDVAYGPYLENDSSLRNKASEIEILRCRIENLKAAIQEIPSLSHANRKGNQLDVAGAVIPYIQTYHGYGIRSKDGSYQGTIISNLQFQLAALKETLSDTYKDYFGALNIDPTLLKWALEQKDRLLFSQDSNEMVMPYSKKKFRIRYQGDFMHDVLKGFIGIRIEGASNILLEDVYVLDIENKGDLSEPNMPYSGAKDGGHEEQGSMIGSFNPESRGIHFSGVDHVTIRRITVKNIYSDFGSIYGMILQNGCRSMVIEDVIIDELHAGEKLETATHVLPNKPQRAYGLVIDDTCKFLHEIKDICVRNHLYQPKPFTSEKIMIGVVEGE